MLFLENYVEQNQQYYFQRYSYISCINSWHHNNYNPVWGIIISYNPLYGLSTRKHVSSLNIIFNLQS